MGGEKRQIYLLKDGDVRFEFVGIPPSNCSVNQLLYEANVLKLEGFPGSLYQIGQFTSICSAIDAGSRAGAEKPKIQISGKYDTFYDTPRIYTKAVFPEQFVTQLSNILAEPRISIRGTYKVLKKEPNSVFYHHLPVVSQLIDLAPMRGMDLEINRPGRAVRRIRFSSFREEPTFTWTPVHEDPQEFSIEGILLKDEEVNYEAFKGIEKMSEYYTKEKCRFAQLKYDVILEWQDYGVNAPEFERSILNELYNGMPLSDCVIVASIPNGGTREFQCHRNIVGVHSDAFLAMLGSGGTKNDRIVIEDVSGDAVELLLQFLYGIETYIESRDEDVVLDLIKIAVKYNIEELNKFLNQFMCSKRNDTFTMNGVLRLYRIIANVESFHSLSEKLRGIMRSNPKLLSACTAYQEWVEEEPRDAAKFVSELLKPPE